MVKRTSAVYESTLNHFLEAIVAEEVELTGGRLTQGVVRIGNTVRRPAKASSAFMARLLKHLEQVGFGGAPRYLGSDFKGRDILSFLPGEVAAFNHFDDAVVFQAGALLRAFHDATRNSDLASGALVVCHHDAGPNNVIFNAGMPVAFIDFDLAAPGYPIEDVGYMAWLWCVTSKELARSVAVQAAQIRQLSDGYGLLARDRARLVDSILDRQTRNVSFWETQMRARDNPNTTDHEIEERIKWSKRERGFTDANRLILDTALR